MRKRGFLDAAEVPSQPAAVGRLAIIEALFFGDTEDQEHRQKRHLNVIRVGLEAALLDGRDRGSLAMQRYGTHAPTISGICSLPCLPRSINLLP